jgi:hypothetical protein
MLTGPTSLEFNPQTGQLWISNAPTSDFTIVHHPGTDQQSVRKLESYGKYHYMDHVSGLAFNAEGSVATAQESVNDYVDPAESLAAWQKGISPPSLMQPNYFMGPVLFNASDAALVTTDGEPCVLNGERTCLLIHTDMLHEAPLAMGIVFNKGWEKDPHPERKAGPNSFWMVDGQCGTIIMYDFDIPHGAWNMDHDNARVHRYANIALKRVPNVPMDLDIVAETRTLYVADTGNSRVLKIYVDTSKRAFSARPFYKIVTSAVESTFDYWVYNETKFEVFAAVDQPSGVAVGGGRVYVSDYKSGTILGFDGSGNEIGRYETGKQGWAGMTLQGNKLWLVNSLTNELGSLSLDEMQAASTSCTASTCGSPKCARCELGGTCSADTQCKSGLCSAGTCAVKPETLTDATCVQRTALTPVGPEPQGVMPMNGDTNAPTAAPSEDRSGYQDIALAIANKDIYATMTSANCTDQLNRDGLLLSAYLCHPCLPNPCFNGGACRNLARGYTCNCARAGYLGDRCEKEITEAPAIAPTGKPSGLPTFSPVPVVVPTYTPSSTPTIQKSPSPVSPVAMSPSPPRLQNTGHVLSSPINVALLGFVLLCVAGL